MRTEGNFNICSEIESISDDLLRNFLEMLYIYNEYLNNAPNERIIELIEKLPTNDFKIAAIEYFSRIFGQNDLIRLCNKEKEFFDFYWNNDKKINL